MNEYMKKLDELFVECFNPLIINGDELPYLIGDAGTVVSLYGKEPKEKAVQFDEKSGRYCMLIYYDKKPHPFCIARLIALAHIPIPDRYKDIPISNLEVDHRDGNKLYDHVSNLRWCTKTENRQFTKYQNLSGKGSNHNGAKLTEDIVHDICRDILNSVPPKNIIRKYNIGRSTYDNIRYHQSWNHITDLYDFPNSKSTIKPGYEDKLEDICKLLTTTLLSNAEIAKQMGMDRCQISKIKNGKIYHSITRHYGLVK